MPQLQLLLASASPARLATLQRAGVTPLVRTSGIDEEAELRTARAKLGILGPGEEAIILARAKAETVAAERSEAGEAKQKAAVILGCDSILEFAGETWGKPKTAQAAHQRWQQMSGRSGLLHTGHWIIDEATGQTAGATAATEVHFAALTEAEIAAYVTTQEPLDVAGGFTIDGRGGWFIEKTVGDHHAVVGVSLPLVRKLLADIGFSLIDFW